MSHVLAITKKELRAYFLSPIALIFLGTFLFVTLFTFFWVETFYARNLADIRPLFSWLPVLLVFLVAALTMRQWSEEQKLGTLEILLTLPVKVRTLVLGKFLAGMALVSLALALTLGVPITVSMMGELDWGPVIGGYLAAILLASAYLAIGLWISSTTDNQIVALLLTLLTCGALFVIGTGPVTNLFGVRGSEILHAIGTGSRFESIGRGVIDLRDLVYYVSLTAFFLVLNTISLESKRWSTGARTRSMRHGMQVMVALAAVNLVVLNVWLGSVGRVRLDLTERHEYSVSGVTKNLVRSLEAPLVIRGYFSEKTHPLLDPLIPRIKDLIQEYVAISGGKVRAEFVDPRTDEDLEKEANETYGIKSFAFKVDNRYEQAVVNSYFSVLLKYGDQHQVLSFDDLIEVQVAGMNKVEVKLRNLEYDLTRTIKKVAYGFQTLDSMFAELSAPMEFTGYISAPERLPGNFKEVPPRVEKILKEIAAQSGGKFKYQLIDPDSPSNPGMREELFKKFGFRPMAVSVFSNESFYLHLLLKSGDRYEQVLPSESLSEADLKNEITAAVKRSSPGFLKTVGLVKPKVEPPPQMPGQFQPPPRPPEMTRLIQEQISQNYNLRTLELTDGRVPGDIDVLVVFGPKNLDEKQVFAIDQYLMRGGSVIVLGGKFEINPNASPHEGLQVEKVEMGLESALQAWGVTIQDKMVLDPQNESFPIPIIRNLGGLKVQDVQLIRYPFFVDVRQSGMAEDSPVTGGIASATLQWVSPVLVSDPPAPKEGETAAKRQVTVLLSSTEKSWATSSTEVQPDFDKYQELGFQVEGERKAFPLAVAVTGRFDSAFKDKASPLWGGDAPGGGGDRTGRTIKSSPETARLIVIGSSSFANDLVLGLSRQVSGDRYTNNLQLVENLVDWSVADVDLLTIRSRGTFARTLLPMEPSTRAFYEYGNYGIVVLALALMVIVSTSRRRRLAPIQLDPARGKQPRPTPGGPAVGSTPTEARS